MAFSNQAFALISISTLLLSTFAMATAPIPRSYISSSPSSSPSESPEPLPHDEKSQLARYVKATMQATAHKLDEVEVALEKRLEDPETSSFTKECIKQCHEVYSAAKEDILSSLEDVDCGDFYKANMDLSSISTNVDTCEECFEEMVGEEPELKKFDDWVRQVTSDCLEAVNKAAS